jgi:hypothetical protein
MDSFSRSALGSGGSRPMHGATYGGMTAHLHMTNFDAPMKTP